MADEKKRNKKAKAGAASKKKVKSAKKTGSLLSRLLHRGSESGAKKPPSNGAPRVKATPLTPLDHSIQEIRSMIKVGERDPERLAMLLSSLLSKEQEKQKSAQEDFDRMVWDIVNKDEATEEGDNAGGSDEGEDRS
ncbi:MAG: hypothetical protein VX733_13205 [Candidatus Latescibacterota bacterium]|nr:hypothetical protein [Candidatus Latescibacterota bacterium]